MAELTNAYLANDISAFEPVLRRYVCVSAASRLSNTSMQRLPGVPLAQVVG